MDCCAPPTSKHDQPLQLDLFHSSEQVRERDRRAADKAAQREQQHQSIVRARTIDPESAHDAAARSTSFSLGHEARILAAIEQFGGPITGHEIARVDDQRHLAIEPLTNVQVLRRTRAMAKDGKLIDCGQHHCRVCGNRETAWGLPGAKRDRIE